MGKHRSRSILAWLLVAVAVVGLGVWVADRRSDPAGELGVRPRPSTGAAGAAQVPELPGSAADPGEMRLDVAHLEHAPAQPRIEGLTEGEQRHGLELTLDPAGRIGGRVVWPDHSPAPGVTVEVSGWTQRDSGAGSEGSMWLTIRWPPARTDAEGRFEIRTPGRGPYTLTVSHRPSSESGRRVRHGEHSKAEDAGTPRYLARLERVAAGDMDLLLVLQRGVRLEGRVVDETGEVPGGARVQARRLTETGFEEASTRHASRAEGTFRFDDLPPGTYEVAATFGAGLGERQRLDVPQLIADLVLVAPRGARIEGYVLAGGSPVEGASVELGWRSGPQRVFLDGERSKEARTDANGRFELHRVVPAEHVLQAKHETLGRSAPHPLRVASGDEVHGLVLELETPGWIEGRIAREIDRRAGRTIHVMSQDTFDFASVTTGADGLFTVPDLRPGIHEVCLPAEGSPSLYDAAVTAAVHAGAGTQVVLSGGSRGVRIRGLVTARGRPVTELEVRAYLMTGTEGFEAGARTDDRGAFELELPEGGGVAFVLGDFDSGPGEQRFVPDGQTTSLRFDLPVGAVAGRVLDHDGRPAADALVRLESEVLSKMQQCQADADGRFTFQHVAPGRHAVSAGGTRLFATGFSADPPPRGARAYGFQRSEPFDLEAGERRTKIDLVLPAPASLRGRLSLPPGSLPGDIWLVATPDTPESRLPVARAEIDGDRYHLRGLGPGLYEIEAIAFGERPSSASRHVTVAEGQELALDLELE